MLRALPLLLLALTAPGVEAATKRPRQTYPFDGVLGWRLDLPLDYAFTRAFKGRLQGTELLLLTPKSLERWTRAGKAPPADGGLVRVEAVAKDDPDFGGVKADLEFMRESMRRARTERGDAFTLEGYAMGLPAFVVRTTKPAPKVEVVAEGRRLLYKFVAAEDGEHLRDVVEGLRESAAPAPKRAPLPGAAGAGSARVAAHARARARELPPREEQRSVETALRLQSEPRIGWKLVPLAHFRRGARHAALTLALFDPEGLLSRDDSVTGVTFERGPDGTLSLLDEAWLYSGDKKALLARQLEGGDYRLVGRREGAPLERLGPRVLEGFLRLRALYRRKLRDDAVKAAADYSRLFAAEGEAFTEWMPRSMLYAADEGLVLKYVGLKKEAGEAALTFRQDFKGRTGSFTLHARPAGRSGDWAVVSASK